MTVRTAAPDRSGAAPTGSRRASAWAGTAGTLIPGLLVCLGITVVAQALQAGEEHLTGHPYVEALVLAILLGTAVRTAWVPGARFKAGIAFSAKQVLEVAVTLLGAAVSLGAIVAPGPALLAGIVGAVALTILASCALCRALGLPVRMALLIACGNAICGNSAIAAVAPVIGADHTSPRRAGTVPARTASRGLRSRRWSSPSCAAPSGGMTRSRERALGLAVVVAEGRE